MAEQRLGLHGFTAALRVVTSYLERSQALETAVKRILDGQADQGFNEAARLAANPQVRGLVRRADREAFAGWAGDQAAPGTENVATVDSVGPEGSVALLGSLTKDELLRLRFHTFQMVRVIVVALASAAVFTDNEVDWALSSAAGGLIVLMDLIDKALKGHVKDWP